MPSSSLLVDWTFSYGDLADIQVGGYTEPEDVITPVISVRPSIVSDLGDGSPPIVLRVRTIGGNNELYWEVKTEALKGGGYLTTIYRDGEVISSTFLDEYTDEATLPEGGQEYHVEQTGRDGVVYRSNTARPENRVPILANVDGRIRVDGIDAGAISANEQKDFFLESGNRSIEIIVADGRTDSQVSSCIKRPEML